MPAPRAVLELVARFEQQLEAHKSGQYHEAQLRRDFLDPRFRLLGWDMDNTAGYAEPYRAVVEEKPEVRKAGGVYYTPADIVDYIVRQTVGRLLEECRGQRQDAPAGALGTGGAQRRNLSTALPSWGLGGCWEAGVRSSVQ